MSHSAQFDIGELLVQGVDLRLPLAPQPIFFAGNTAIDAEVKAAIRRYMADGEIVSVPTTVEAAPKYCVFLARDDGRVDAAVFQQIDTTFKKHGTEACCFQYDPIEHKFVGRDRGWFLPARIIFT